MPPFPTPRPIACALLAAALACAPAFAQHAHTHGRATLEASVDAREITVRLEAPLDSLLGFERAPRTDAERRRVADMATRLRAADQWLKPDPAAGCAAAAVELQAPVLGLGGAPDAGAGPAAEAHADLEVTVRLPCASPAQARFLDVDLFGSFPGLRSIDAQVAAPQGQSRRTLRRGAVRLGWGR